MYTIRAARGTRHDTTRFLLAWFDKSSSSFSSHNTTRHSFSLLGNTNEIK
jgi:hypothetical protein